MTVPLSRPPVDDEIRQAGLAAIDSRQYILGPQCKALESELAAHAGVRHAILTSSGTAALWMTLRALGAGPGRLGRLCHADRVEIEIDVTQTPEGRRPPTAHLAARRRS